MKQLFVFALFLFSIPTTLAQNNPYQDNVLWVTTPDHTDWLYALNTEANITVSLYEYGILQDNLTISYSIGPELLPADKNGTIVLKNGKAVISLGTMTKPGFRDCQLSFELHC